MSIQADLLTAQALGLSAIHPFGNTTSNFRAAEICSGWGLCPSLQQVQDAGIALAASEPALPSHINAQAPLATQIATDRLLIRFQPSRIIISLTRWYLFSPSLTSHPPPLKEREREREKKSLIKALLLLCSGEQIAA